jgi:hypothetical protein
VPSGVGATAGGARLRDVDPSGEHTVHRHRGVGRGLGWPEEEEEGGF